MNIELMDLGVDEEELDELLANKVGYKKQLSKIISKSRKDAKADKCLHCDKKVNSFCNSHSVPAFALRNIEVDGDVYFSNALVEFPLMDNGDGVNRAGTFKIICRECDSKIFSAYENPDAYKEEATPVMMAQIAMKNHLKVISKRLIEKGMYESIKEINPFNHEFVEHMHSVQDLDLNEAIKAYKRAKRASEKGWGDEYYLFCYEKLNYVVPIAFQSSITLITDLEGRIINDIYNISEQYLTQDIEIAVFPLKESSVVIMFRDTNNNRYRKFCKMFKKLSIEEKLGIINYIIFLYSEDVFISKAIPKEVLNDENLKDVAKQTTMAMGMFPMMGDTIDKAVKVYNLNNWRSIPNLLSEGYRVR